jgi:hypothetical protein
VCVAATQGLSNPDLCLSVSEPLSLESMGEDQPKRGHQPALVCPGCTPAQGVSPPSPSQGWTNLVDPASSHMLRSRAKPCTSQRKRCNSGSVNGSLHQQSSTRYSVLGQWHPTPWTSTKTLWLIHARTSQPCDARETSRDHLGGPGRPVVADLRPADTKTSGRTGQCVVVVDSGWPSVAAVLADSVVASPSLGCVIPA